MKRTLSIILFSVVTLWLAVSTAVAADGMYLGVQAGATWLDDISDRETINDPTLGIVSGKVESDFDTGFNVGATGGYDYGMLRMELELGYRQNDVDSFDVALSGLGSGSFSADGDVSALSLLLNAWFDLENPTPFVPYAGGGVGFANVSYNDVEIEGIPLVDDDDNVFAYQLGAGLAFSVTPFTALDLGYRYFATSDPEIEGEDLEYETHNVSLGLRIMF